VAELQIGSDSAEKQVQQSAVDKLLLLLLAKEVWHKKFVQFFATVQDFPGLELERVQRNVREAFDFA